MASQEKVNSAIDSKQKLSNQFDHSGNSIASPWDKVDFNQKATGRQDVPSMTRHNTGVVTIAQKGPDGKLSSIYVPFALFEDNPRLAAPQTEKIKGIGAGDAKSPDLGVISGKLSRTQKIPDDIESWTQVGFNPDRHSYFYLKSDQTKGVTGGEKIAQIGNTVFVKNPVFATPEEQASYKYMPFAGEGATGFAEAEKRGGVFVNPFDFMKRFEISDDKMESKDAWQKLMDSTASSKITIEDLYDHEELFKSYPWLRNVPVIKDLNLKSHASARDDNRIRVGDDYLRQLFYDKNPTENILAREYYLKKTIIHEIQHLIQFREKFPRGVGTSKEFLLQRLNDIEASKIKQIDQAEQKFDAIPYNELNKLKAEKINKDLIILKEDLSKWQKYYFDKYFYRNGKFIDLLSRQQLFDLYFSAVGEMESRMASDRSEFSDDYRKQNPAIYQKQAHPFLNFYREFPYPQLDAIYDAKMAEANAQRLKVDRYMPLDVFATPEEQASYKYMPFAGERATGFAEAEKRGDVFVNPFDLMKRFEIADDKMESLNAWRKLHNDGDKFDFILGDLYDHPELFKNYPWLKDLPVIVEFKNDDADASVNYDGTQINVEFQYLKKIIDTVNFNNEKYPTQQMQDRADYYLKKTMIHEIQHLIQFEEKFAMGGNSAESSLRDTLTSIKYAKQEALRKAVDKFNRSSSKDEKAAIALDVNKMRTDLDLWDQHYKNTYGFSYGKFEPVITKMQLWQLYQSLAGEMESRAAEDRSGMTSEDRKKFPVIFDIDYKDNPIVTFRLPSSEKYKSIEDANAKRLGVDRYMPLDELAEEMNIPRTLSKDYNGKQINSIMADHMEAYNFKERAMARLMGQPVSSGGQGYAIKNHGTGVVWASEPDMVTGMLGNLNRRGGKFQEEGKQGENNDWFVLVAPFTMKKDALASNNEFAKYRINQLKQWAALNPDKYESFKKDIIKWSTTLKKPKAKAAEKNYGVIKYPFYKEFDLNNFNFSTNSEGGSTFTQKKDLIQEIKRLENKYEMPSTDELVHHSGDPFLYGVAQRTMLQAEEAMFHSVVIKINLSANERALAIQKYRFKQGPEEIEEVKRAFKDKNFDFSKININNPFNPKAQYKGTNAEEYGVDAHASYGRVILGDTVAMLRNPVRFDSIFPDLLERFKKFHSFISEYRKLNNLNESYMNISGWIGMNPMGNTVDEASPKFRLEKDQNGVWKAKSVIDKTLPLSISGQVLTKELISKINEEQSDEKISAYKKASEKYNEAKLKSFQKRNATISSNSVISDIGKLKLAASSLDKKQAKKINEDHLRASRRLAIPNFFKERAQQRIDEAAKKVADKAKRDANKVANKAKRDAKKATASTTVEAP
jgi:predicted SprT family Zn-dependent metalloprotease